MRNMSKFLSIFLILTMVLTIFGNVVLVSAENSTVPTKIESVKIENFVRFGATGRLDTSAFDMVTDRNIFGQDAPVAMARGIQRNGNAADGSGKLINIGSFGMRSNTAGTFSVSEDNTYVLVTYWVMSRLNGSEEGTPLTIKPYMFYYNGTSAKGSYPVAGKSAAEEVVLEDGVWYKAYHLFKLPQKHIDAGNECTNIGFKMDIGADALKQQTFVGGLEAWNFGTSFSYGSITDPEEAIKAYVADNTAKSIKYGGAEIDGFDPDVTSYVADKAEHDVIDVSVNSEYADIISADINSETKVATVKIGSYSADGYSVCKQGEYANINEYKIWLREQSGWSIGTASADTLSQGANTVDVSVTNTGSGTAKLYAVVYDTSSNAVFDVKAVDVSSTGTYPITVNAPKSNGCMEVFVADSVSNKPLTAKKTLIGTPSQTIAAGNTVEVKGQKLNDAFPLRIGVVAKANTSGEAVFADVIEANHNGEYEFSFIPKEMDTETKFTAYLTDEKSGTMKSVPFEYYSDNAVKAAIKWFETASEAQVAEVLDVSGKMVNNTIEMSYLLSSENNAGYASLKGSEYVDRTLIYQSLAGKTFADANALNSAFKATLDDILVCKEFGEADSEELKILVKGKGSAYGLYVTKGDYGFDKMTDEHYEALLKTLQGKYYRSTKELAKAYNDALVLYIFNNYSANLLEGAVAAYKDLDELKLDTSSEKYLAATSTSTKKSDFYKTLANAEYKTLGDIKTTFNNTVNVSESGSSGGSSGGGGGNSSSIRPPIYDSNEDNKGSKEDNPTPAPSDDNKSAFGDLTNGYWAEEYILDLYDRKIVSGDDKGNFNAESEITRAEYAKMLVLALNLYDGNANADFKDSSPEDWYYSYVASGVNAGIINGVGDGKFGSDDPVSRQDMAVLAYRAMLAAGLTIDDIKDENTAFSDKNDIADYAVEGVEFVQKLGIINGMGDNKFMPKSHSTRAMAAKIISLILNLNNQ